MLARHCSACGNVVVGDDSLNVLGDVASATNHAGGKSRGSKAKKAKGGKTGLKKRRSRHGITTSAERAAAVSECLEAVESPERREGLLENLAERCFVLKTTIKRWIQSYVKDKKMCGVPLDKQTETQLLSL